MVVKMLQREYTEKRILCIGSQVVWKHLTNSNFLSNWMPFITNIEHLSNKCLQLGSLLWIEYLADKKDDFFIVTVSAYEEGRLISFDSTQNGQQVSFTYNLTTIDEKTSQIIMITKAQFKFWHLIFIKRLFHHIVVHGWMQLDALDKAVTLYRMNLEKD